MEKFSIFFFEIDEYENVDAKKKSEYLVKNNKKLEAIFRDESLIKFICQSCKSEPSYKTMKSNLEREIESLQASGSNLNSYEQKIEDLETKIATLKSKMEKTDDENEKSNNEMKTVLVTLKSKFETFKNDIDSEIENTISLMNESDSNGINNNDDADLHSNHDQFVNNFRGGSGRNKNNKIPFPIPFVDPDIIDQHSHTQNVTNDINPNQGLYEIYVAKFKTNVKSDQIKQFIIDSTTITDPDLFHVQMLGDLRFNRTFISFKITTMKYEVCSSILNMDWKPQSAHMFHRNGPRRGNTNRPNYNNPFRRRNDTRFERENHSRNYNRFEQPRNSYNRANRSEFYDSYRNHQNRNFNHNTNNNNRNGYRNNYRNRENHRNRENYQQHNRNQHEQGFNETGNNSQIRQNNYRDNFLDQNQHQERNRYNPFRRYNNKR